MLVLGIGFHLATMFLMNIFFPYHLAMYVVFVDWRRLLAQFKSGWEGYRVRGTGPLSVSN